MRNNTEIKLDNMIVKQNFVITVLDLISFFVGGGDRSSGDRSGEVEDRTRGDPSTNEEQLFEGESKSRI